MDDQFPRRLRRSRAGNGDTADRPSDLRQALADLGRVIGEPLPVDPEPGAVAVPPL